MELKSPPCAGLHRLLTVTDEHGMLTELKKLGISLEEVL